MVINYKKPGMNETIDSSSQVYESGPSEKLSATASNNFNNLIAKEWALVDEIAKNKTKVVKTNQKISHKVNFLNKKARNINYEIEDLKKLKKVKHGNQHKKAYKLDIMNTLKKDKSKVENVVKNNIKMENKVKRLLAKKNLQTSSENLKSSSNQPLKVISTSQVEKKLAQSEIIEKGDQTETDVLRKLHGEKSKKLWATIGGNEFEKKLKIKEHVIEGQ